MALEMFAGIRVADFRAAVPWYTDLFGAEPSFFPHDTEAVWELAEHRMAYVVEDAARAGTSVLTLMVDDLDERVAALGERGLEPAEEEAYDNGVRKVSYRDADGNEVAFGGMPDD